jgi:hypothetical protein
MKAGVIFVTIVIGLAFVGLAGLYWLTLAQNLPAFVPGYEPGNAKPHFTHGLGALMIALVAFATAWLRSWGD